LQRGEAEFDKEEDKLKWENARRQAALLREARDRALLKGPWFSIEQLTGPASILMDKGSHVTLAVFLNQNGTAELPSKRFGNQTPISFALHIAQDRNLDWVVVIRGSELRLYPARTDVGVGHRGLTDTYLSVDLEMLPEVRLPFVWLTMSAEALQSGGILTHLREKSERYAIEIGRRLRDRIYTTVIPSLAMGIASARGLKKTVC
jgi:hypothetical protein